MTDTTAPDVRVPNVSPGAVSGLDHAPLQGAPTPAEFLDDTDEAPFPAVPADLTTVDALLGWVEEDDDETPARAVSVLVQERQSEQPRKTLVEPLERKVLDYILDGAVIQPTDTEDAGDPDALTGAATVTTTGQGEAVQVHGQSVDSATAGTGEAVNAETGEVTQPGDPLPEVGDPDGTPLPPQPGADDDGFGGDAPEPANPPA